MGIGRVYQCGCGYRVEFHYGSGFWPAEKIVAEKIRSGEFGKKWKLFLLEHSDLKIQADQVLCVCPSCGFFKSGFDARFVKDGGAFYGGVKRIELVKRVETPCDKCGVTMNLYLEGEKAFPVTHTDWQTRRSRLGYVPRLRCPDCGNVLKPGSFVKWD